ncbi:MAG: ABC transporter permease [Chromatiales bacterium]|jgi:ABC-2 type transport system permease protein
MILSIARTELKRMFYSPMAWSVLAVVQLILALMFLIFLNNFVTRIQLRFAGLEGAPGVADAVVAPLYIWASIVMLAVTPLLTMRLLSEERQNRSLSLLISSPVTITDIVLGKYLGLMLFVLIMLGIVTLMPISLALGTDLDWGKLASGFLGLLLLLGSFSAAGLYLSSLTVQPIIAAVSSFGLLLFLVILYISGNTENTASELFVYLSHYSHFLSFVEGVFDSADLAYYLLFIAAFLILTIRRLDNERLQR